jgi:cell wall-associated NlpC family hydrolase
MTVTGAQIAAEIEKFAGFPYVWGGTSPSGFDCSGLVKYVLEQLGIKGVPRTSEEQFAWVDKVSASQAGPGTLVFAQFPGDNASPGHVGIMTSTGEVLSAEDPAHGVGFSSLASWGGNIVGYGNVPGSAASKASGGGASDLSVSGVVGSILGLPSDVLSMFDSLSQVAQAAFWFFQPTNWARIVAGLLGLVFLGAGVAAFAKAA